jgi:hypothetical protein
LGQHFGHFFNPFARLTINHTRFTFVLTLNESKQLRRGIFFLNNGVPNVGPIKAADEKLGIFKLKTLNDVGASRASAVAVSATLGTPGKRSCKTVRLRYSGRKS